MKIYAAISIIIALFDLFCANLAFRRNHTGRLLGITCILAAVVDLSYLLSAVTKIALAFSITSSIYFSAITFMLLFLTRFKAEFSQRSLTKAEELLNRFLGIYAWAELVCFALNPVFHFVIRYVPSGNTAPYFQYEMLPLYYLHLAVSYLMVGYFIFLLIVKLAHTPRQFRFQHEFILVIVLGIVAVNGFYLFYPGETVFADLDFSLWGYGIGLLCIYLASYSLRLSLNKELAMMVFDNIRQGIVLFDYNDYLVMRNDKVLELLKGIPLEEGITREQFLKDCSIPDSAEPSTSQLYLGSGIQRRTVRCDSSRLLNNGTELVGSLYVFTDMQIEKDLLTGFADLNGLLNIEKDPGTRFPVPSSVAVFDIRGLSAINSRYGTGAGDLQLRGLSEILRNAAPRDMHLFRGRNADLLAVSPSMDAAAMREFAEMIVSASGNNVYYGCSCTGGELDTMEKAMTEAHDSLMLKKLMDTSSSKSGVLSSLVSALSETDEDTEFHVQRTQKMGDLLGKRLNLSDMQRSQLSLLCLLHDIGKIGVPLEILNKPGHLNREEWNVLRSHVEKGYRIAISTPEIRSIADMIRCHHERWDGNGYPDGISGENIPLLSRIISIVDTYDAMVNDRSYRRAISPGHAQEEIRRCAGTQFDPRLVDEFLKLLEEVPGLGAGQAGTHNYTVSAELTAAEIREEIDPAGSGTEAEGTSESLVYSRYLLDSSEKILEIDTNFTEITGYTWEDVNSMSLSQWDLIPEAERAYYRNLVMTGIQRNNVALLRHPLQRKDGTVIEVFCTGRPYYDSAIRKQRSEVIIHRV